MKYLWLIALLIPGMAIAAIPDGVTVVITGTGNLSWTPPIDNVDGSPLTNLAGYNIHIGRASGDYTVVLPVAIAGNSSGTVVVPITDENDINWFFAMTAYKAPFTDPDTGQLVEPESVFSSEVGKVLSVTFTDGRNPKPPTSLNVDLNFECNTSDQLVTCVITVQ